MGTKRTTKKQKGVEGACALKIHSFLKNNFSVLNSFVEGQNLSGWF